MRLRWFILLLGLSITLYAGAQTEVLSDSIDDYYGEALPDSLFEALMGDEFQPTIDTLTLDSLTQDSLVYDTVQSISDFYSGTFSDTIMLQNLPKTADMEDWLMNLLAVQGQRLYGNDTAHVITVADVIRMDSLRQDQEMLDSLKQLNAGIQSVQGAVQEVVVQKSWIKDSEEDRADIKRALKDMKTPWRKSADVLLQVTQNYATDNWYQGKMMSFAILSQIKGNIGYFSPRFTWENTAEWRAGCSTISGDSLRILNTSDDKFRLYTKANYQIVKQMYASFSAEYEMQLLPTFKANEIKMKSAFASPIRLNLGLGIDYKPIAGLSILFSPLAYKMVYVSDTTYVTQTDFGVKAGENILNDVGSSFRVEYVWKPVREVALDTKFYLYTNYQKVELDLEVICDFIINRFLSARVTLHPRYDNTVILEGKEKAQLQFKELVSVGFAHKFK